MKSSPHVSACRCERHLLLPDVAGEWGARFALPRATHLSSLGNNGEARAKSRGKLAAASRLFECKISLSVLVDARMPLAYLPPFSFMKGKKNLPIFVIFFSHSLSLSLPLSVFTDYEQLLTLIMAACQFSIQISSLSGERRAPFHQPQKGRGTHHIRPEKRERGREGGDRGSQINVAAASWGQRAARNNEIRRDEGKGHDIFHRSRPDLFRDLEGERG